MKYHRCDVCKGEIEAAGGGITDGRLRVDVPFPGKKGDVRLEISLGDSDVCVDCLAKLIRGEDLVRSADDKEGESLTHSGDDTFVVDSAD